MGERAPQGPLGAVAGAPEDTHLNRLSSRLQELSPDSLGLKPVLGGFNAPPGLGEWKEGGGNPNRTPPLFVLETHFFLANREVPIGGTFDFTWNLNHGLRVVERRGWGDCPPRSNEDSKEGNAPPRRRSNPDPFSIARPTNQGAERPQPNRVFHGCWAKWGP